MKFKIRGMSRISMPASSATIGCSIAAFKVKVIGLAPCSLVRSHRRPVYSTVSAPPYPSIDQLRHEALLLNPRSPCYSEVGCLASRAELLAIGRGAGADAAVRPAFSCSACRRGRRVVVGLAAPREGLDDDHAATAAATRTRHRAGFVGGCGRGGPGRFRAGRHGEQLARPCEVGGAIAVGEKSIVADAVQAVGENVRQLG